MDILAKKDYCLLKLISQKTLTKNEICVKHNPSRLQLLSENNYVYFDGATDMWGTYEPSTTVKISEQGLMYLENHKWYVRRERFLFLRDSICVPIVVSLLVTALSQVLLYWL